VQLAREHRGHKISEGTNQETGTLGRARFHRRRKSKLKPGRIHTGAQEKAETEKTNLVLLALD
jgi:hypothetical protein